MHSVFVPPILSMFTSDKLTNYNHCGVAPGALSVFTTDRLTKVQSQEAARDLENVFVRNPKSPPFLSL